MKKLILVMAIALLPSCKTVPKMVPSVQIVEKECFTVPEGIEFCKEVYNITPTWVVVEGGVGEGGKKMLIVVGREVKEAAKIAPSSPSPSIEIVH